MSFIVSVLRRLLFNRNKNEDGSRRRASDMISDKPTQFVFATLLYILSGFLVVYLLLFIHLPNKKFVNRPTEDCIIVKAELSCWRRKLLSSSSIEQGRHTCWIFSVRHTSNITTLTQYSQVRDFPKELNGCDSEEKCGMEVWPCRIGEDPAFVSLRWSYPMKSMIYAVVSLILTFSLGTYALVMSIRARLILRCVEKIEDEAPSIPFYSNLQRNFK